MSEKIYEYNGKHYCDKDISETDDLYEGDLYDMYWEMRKNLDAYENTYYYVQDGDVDGRVYESAEDMIAAECEDMIIGEVESGNDN